MKKILMISAIAAACAFSPGFAETTKTPIYFKPYADFTINAHWDSETQDMQPMDLAKISQESGIKNYSLAFITDAGVCSPAWGAYSDYSVDKAWGKRLTEKLKTLGVNFVVALGGAIGNDLSANCSPNDLVKAYEKVINTYQPIGLDFDIENGTAKVDKVMSAVAIIQQKYPNLKISFTLPVLPDGLVFEGKEIVRKAKEAGLNYTVNIMAMDYGPAFTEDMGQYAIQAATNLFNYLKSLYPQKTDPELWKMVEITPMIGLNDVTVEKFTLANVDTVREFAKQKQIGGLAMWSVARDKPCADAWVSTICSSQNLQTKPNEFAERFLR